MGFIDLILVVGQQEWVSLARPGKSFMGIGVSTMAIAVDVYPPPQTTARFLTSSSAVSD
jgi:hypothetical protein